MCQMQQARAFLMSRAEGLWPLRICDEAEPVKGRAYLLFNFARNQIPGLSLCSNERGRGA